MFHCLGFVKGKYTHLNIIHVYRFIHVMVHIHC